MKHIENDCNKTVLTAVYRTQLKLPIVLRTSFFVIFSIIDIITRQKYYFEFINIFHFHIVQPSDRDT